MKHPPYHLRTNKAIDRYMLIEAARLIGTPVQVAEYTYYGFGGPYLEDFRLMHEAFPKMKLFSFEEDPETYKRQQFHLPCSHIKLSDMSFKTFLRSADLDKSKAIFWLDYTGLELTAFEDFKFVLDRVALNSVIKLTVRCHYQDYRGKIEEFQQKFDAVLEQRVSSLPNRMQPFAHLIQGMFQLAAQQVLSATKLVFQPIYSSCYMDGVGMFSLCGMLCQQSDVQNVRRRFGDHRIANLEWKEPTELDVPFLSTKERLRLQEHLPCETAAGKTLAGLLGYLIDETKASSDRKLEQYANYYAYYPMFMKATP